MDSTDDINNTENCTDYTTQLHNYKTVQLHWVVLFHWLQWPHCVLHNGNSDYTDCINFTLCLHCNGKTIINFGSPIQSSNTMRLIKWFLLIWSITPTTRLVSQVHLTTPTALTTYTTWVHWQHQPHLPHQPHQLHWLVTVTTLTLSTLPTPLGHYTQLQRLTWLQWLHDYSDYFYPTNFNNYIYFIDYNDYTDDMNNTDYIHYTTTKLQWLHWLH